MVADESPVASDSFAVVKIVGLTAGESVIFEVSPEPKKLIEVKDGIHFNGSEKKYQVVATIINWEARQFYKKKLDVPFGVKPNPPPEKPPVTPISSLYFLIIRPDGPVDMSFTKAMSLPAWATIRDGGHEYKEKTVSEAKALGYNVKSGTKIPTVITLSIVDGKSTVVRESIDFPVTNEKILELPNGVK